MTSRTPLEDRIAAMVANVVDDIRHKVVEEPWYGRTVTGKISDIHHALDQSQERTRAADLDRFYGRQEPATPEKTPGRDYGIDR